MANPIIKIKRGATAPVATLNAGEFAIDQVAKNLYLGIDDGAGNITNEVVGGNGTFATHADVVTAVTTATNLLGTMSTQNANSVAITGGTIDGTSIGANTPSTGAFTTLNSSNGGSLVADNVRIINAPTQSDDAVRKTDLDTAISALGSVFHYVGDVSSAATPLDLSTLSDTTTGAYYKVDVAGAYTDGATTFNALVGDAFVKTSTGWQKLDNVDVEVLPTANEISVTGDENVGYTVSIDPVFSGRVSSVEDKTQHITATAAPSGQPNNGLTSILGGFEAGVGSGSTLIKVPINAGTLEFNEFGNQSVKSHATLELVSSGWGIPTGAGGGYSIKADGRIMTSAGGLDVTGDSTLTGNLSVTGTVGGTNITDLETKTQNITASAGETDVSGILTSQELWVGPNSSDTVKLLNATGGTQAILEMPAGKEFVIKTDSGADAIKVGSGNGRVDFAYDVNVNTILSAANLSVANSTSLNTLSVNSTANFNGGINLNTGNLVGNGTNEITDFIIDGGVY